MITLQLDMYQACALGALVYCLGRLMVNKLSFLSKYCIPAPVAGGIVFAFAHLALYAAGILELSNITECLHDDLLLQRRIHSLLPSVEKGRTSGISVPRTRSRHLCHPGRSWQRSRSSLWSGSAARLMYGFHAVSRRTRNIRFLRTAS